MRTKHRITPEVGARVKVDNGWYDERFVVGKVERDARTLSLHKRLTVTLVPEDEWEDAVRDSSIEDVQRSSGYDHHRAHRGLRPGVRRGFHPDNG